MSVVKFLVLGAVDACVDGRSVRLGGPKRRAMLAVLLLNANQVVPVAQLVDALWEPEPPSSVRSQVQALVHGLRRALADAGVAESTIETRAPGYLIRVEPDAFDLTLFEQRVAEARADAAVGRREAAAEGLRAALGLWRGVALGGVEAPFAGPAVARLEELRLSVLAERIDADLALGRHRALVPELRALVAEHPLRESLRGQLMLALYRCGRQAEALETYRQGRAAAVAELGLDPGPELRRLEAAILAGDGALDLPPAAPPGTDLPAAETPAAGSTTVGATGRTAAQPAAGPAPGPAAEPGAPPPASFGPAPASAGTGPVPSGAPRGGRWRGRASHRALLATAFATAVVVTAAVTAMDNSGAPQAGVTQPQLRPQYAPGPVWTHDPPVPVPSTLFGVTMNSISGAMPGFRVGAIRLWDSGTRWSEIQPQRGEFRWETLDRLVAGATKAGLPVLFVFGGTPAWASPDGPRTVYPDDSRSSPPDDLTNWDRFVQAVGTRYRGRIGAYELWNLANQPKYYSGDIPTLVEMTRRAVRILRRTDPGATTVCPSMGELWDQRSRDFLQRFAAAGGYQDCSVAGVKLHQRDFGDKPETIVQLTTIIERTFHDAGVHLRLWNTGTAYRIASAAPLPEDVADAYAVRFYLIGLYARYERMYFYNWGGRKIPIVLQAEGGPPTRAALFVEKLQQWLDGARIRSCGHSGDENLPDNVWQCQFTVPRPSGGFDEAAICWTIDGQATVPAGPRAYRVQYLDGHDEPIKPGAPERLTEQPVLIRSHPAKVGAQPPA